jgi:transposase
MEQFGAFPQKHIEGIAAYCNHPVRFGVVESINTTIKPCCAAREEFHPSQ